MGKAICRTDIATVEEQVLKTVLQLKLKKYLIKYISLYTYNINFIWFCRGHCQTFFCHKNPISFFDMVDNFLKLLLKYQANMLSLGLIGGL